MTRMAVPPRTDELLLSFHYANDVVYIFDNSIIGWAVDADDASVEPAPRLIGSLPPAVDTAPVLSPQWAAYNMGSGVAYVPDIFCGRLPDLLVFLAENNGATRQINGDGLTQNYVKGEFEHFSAMNPELVFPRLIPPTCRKIFRASFRPHTLPG
jgi:hypothetical protein